MKRGNGRRASGSSKGRNNSNGHHHNDHHNDNSCQNDNTGGFDMLLNSMVGMLCVMAILVTISFCSSQTTDMRGVFSVQPQENMDMFHSTSGSYSTFIPFSSTMPTGGANQQPNAMFSSPTQGQSKIVFDNKVNGGKKEPKIRAEDLLDGSAPTVSSINAIDSGAATNGNGSSNGNIISMDPDKNHVQLIQTTKHNLNMNNMNAAYQKTTIPEYDVISKMNSATVSNKDGKSVSHNFQYYYYDSFTQSFHLHQDFTTYPEKPPTSFASTSVSTVTPSLHLPNKYPPTLCSDSSTYGYSEWNTLRNAIHELNEGYKYAVSRWGHYNAALSEYETIRLLHAKNQSSDKHNINGGHSTLQKAFEQELVIHPPPFLPDHLTELLDVKPDPFVICPHAVLRPSQLSTSTSSSSHIHINAEDVVIECDSCVIDVPGTHFSFGELAVNVVVRGLTLRGATTSSLVFHNDGADAMFEDCYWMENTGSGMSGAVCDMNSVSSIKFFRCDISDAAQKQPRKNGLGGNNSNEFVTSLTLRTGK